MSLEIENGVLKDYQPQNGETAVTIPEGVTEIGIWAFSGCTSLTSVTIPAGVTEIGYEAFKGCTSLTSVVIPEGVTEISTKAFYKCRSLTSVTIPESVTEIGSGAFEGTPWLKAQQKKDPLVVVNGILIDGKRCKGDATIPEGVTVIGGAAFLDCRSLTSVTIPGSVKEIGWGAFYDCKNLTSVTISAGVTGISIEAFFGTAWLKAQQKKDPLVVVNGILINGKTCAGDVVIPVGVTEIGREAFRGCTSLTSVTIPAGVTEIGREAFRGCTSLTSVTIPGSVTEIGEDAFCGCTGLTSVTIPAGVKEIGEDAFWYCENLTSVTIPENVTKIGSSAFEGTPWLKAQQKKDPLVVVNGILINGKTCAGDVVIPAGVKEIGACAFYECTNLTSVTIPGSVTEIGREAFSGCTGLTSVMLPDHLTDIGEGAFPQNTQLPESYFCHAKKLPDVCAYGIPTARAMSFVVLNQNGKAWSNACLDLLLEGRISLADMMDESCTLLEAGQEKAAVKKVVGFIARCQMDVPASALQRFAQAVKQNKCEELLAPLAGRLAMAAALPGVELPINGRAPQPEETELLALIPSSLPFAFLQKEAAPFGVDFSDLPLRWADGRDVPCDFVLQCILAGAEYVGEERWRRFREQALALLEPGAVDILFEKWFSKERTELFPFFGAFCSGATIQKMYAGSKKFGKKKTDKEAAQAVLQALLLSDSREALLILEKENMLEEAARRRGMTVDELRDSVLADFGFDETGVKEYALSGRTLRAVLQADLQIVLQNENGDPVKTFPKKGNEAAAKDFADLKKNVKKVVAQRALQLLTAFATGTEQELNAWKRVYVQNPVLRQLASLLVWELRTRDGSALLFRPTMEKYFLSANGSALKLPAAGRVRLAHPVEMTAEELSAWQSHLTERRIAQPFTQMFEHVYKADRAALAKRYSGIKVLFVHAKRLEKEGEVNYSKEAVLYGVRLEMSINSDDNWGGDWAQRTVELGAMHIPKDIAPRTLNHVLALVDYMCLDGAARTDRPEILAANAESITEKNVQKLIDTAIAAQATNATAWLLEFKNRHFGVLDVWADLELEL